MTTRTGVPNFELFCSKVFNANHRIFLIQDLDEPQVPIQINQNEIKFLKEENLPLSKKREKSLMENDEEKELHERPQKVVSIGRGHFRR